MIAGKYTALEIVKALEEDFDFELGDQTYTAEEIFGKFRVRINGIAGINRPDKLIKFQPGTEKVTIVIGNDSYELDIKKLGDDVSEDNISVGAKKALEDLSPAKNAKMKEMMIAKGRPEADSDTLASKPEQRRIAEQEAAKAKTAKE